MGVQNSETYNYRATKRKKWNIDDCKRLTFFLDTKINYRRTVSNREKFLIT